LLAAMLPLVFASPVEAATTDTLDQSEVPITWLGWQTNYPY
jgi:hypothetical protein